MYIYMYVYICTKSAPIQRPVPAAGAPFLLGTTGGGCL